MNWLEISPTQRISEKTDSTLLKDLKEDLNVSGNKSSLGLEKNQHYNQLNKKNKFGKLIQLDTKINYKDNITLVQTEKNRQMKQDKKPRNKPTHVCIL